MERIEMDEKEVKQKVIETLETHRYLYLATVTPEGNPLSHTVAYASEGPVVFFATKTLTRKVGNIEKHPEVAFTVNDSFADVHRIHGVQAVGEAVILSEEQEIEKAAMLLSAKFPFLADILQEMDLTFVKVLPRETFYLDFSMDQVPTVRARAVF